MGHETPKREGTAPGMYRAIWRVTARDQVVLIGVSVVVAALAAVPLKFQQLVVNSLVEEGGRARLAWLSPACSRRRCSARP